MTIIACVGACGVDRYLEPRTDRAGGASLNVAANLARLAPSLDVHLISGVGNDKEADMVLEAVRALPLKSHVSSLTGTTAVQQLRVDGNGERQIVDLQVGAVADLRFSPTQKAVLSAADWVLTVVHRQLEPFHRRLLATPRRGRLTVDFMDLANYDRSLPQFEEFLPPVDVAFFGLSSKDSELIDLLRGRARHTGKTFIITLGADGALCFVGGVEHQVAALPVTQVIDTTGAGDAFAAAFLARFLTGGPLPEALVAASRQAALTVSQLGAF